MSILAGFLVPHPPLIIPEVGKGREVAIQTTIDSYRRVAEQIASLAPETVIVVSPHATPYSDYIHLSPGQSAEGSLQQFGAPGRYRADYDAELTDEIGRVCEKAGFPAGTEGREDRALDHGTIIPLYFINQCYAGYRLVRVSISGLSRAQHYRFGMLFREAVESLGRKAVLVASGDLSHKLKADGPYGFAPEGPKLDAALVDILRSGDFGALFDLDERMCANAAECGLAGFIMLAGALDRKAVEPCFLSYEGPFGVGYAVGGFRVKGDNPARNFLNRRSADAGHYVRLARETLEGYIRTGHMPPLPDGLPPELSQRRAGAFVSIKKRGELRGCIGTIGPTRPNLALEIMENAVASGTRDPRFPPVRPDELSELVYSVDVLSPAEPVSDRGDLDEKRYGVIVTRGHKRGLLLPNLEGVDSVEEQLRIACRKAGIGEGEPYSIERFEVVRYT